MTVTLRKFIACALLALPVVASSAPTTFEEAKIVARSTIYADQNKAGTFYCGCTWTWAGRSGGRVDLQSCGYEIRSNAERASRIEWEHVMPAENFGRALPCWRSGGRRFCQATDPLFNRMEADLHNLVPAIGEVNADRSNFRFGVLEGEPRSYGACDVEVSFGQRVAEPRESIRGQIARIHFYMADRYNLTLSNQQQQLFMAWATQFPVTEWERVRDRRIASRMGHSNPFVTGAKVWSKGHRNGSEGLAAGWRAERGAMLRHPAAEHAVVESAGVRGNRRSRIYHLANGCPSFNDVSSANRIEFESEADAIAAGFRRAGNCSS